MAKRFAKINVLFTAKDKDLLDPVLEQLRSKGIRVSESGNGIQKKSVILAALSKNFYDDSEAVDKLLDLISQGAANVLPVRLDDTPVPDTVKNVLYSRNIIAAAGREAPQIAARIISALPETKPVLPVILIGASVVIALLAGFIVWRATRITNEPEPTASIPNDIVIPATLAGLTNDDLSRINCVAIVGDQLIFSSVGEDSANPYTIAYDTYDEDGTHWYSNTDGHEFQMTHYDDLRFISLIPNLRELSLALVDADASALPDLTGMLSYGTIRIADCNIESLEWLSGCKAEHLQYFRSAVKDFSSLSGCDRLLDAEFDLNGQTEADLSRFAPPLLKELRIRNGGKLDSIDLSALKGHQKLQSLEMDYIPLSDLSFLEDSTTLSELILDQMYELDDISVLGSLKELMYLDIQNSPGITDYSPVSGCTALKRFSVQCDNNPDALRDASFLSDLPNLNDIHLYSCNLYNMDFLEGISKNQSKISLGFAGDIEDYSGLSYISRYEYIHVNPRHDEMDSGDFSLILPYIRYAKIDSIQIYDCRNVDLSELPDDISDLRLSYCDITDLSGIKPYYSLENLVLDNCQYLTSLNGIENLPTVFGNGKKLRFEINGCLRLTDYSALEGAHIFELELSDIYTLPDMTLFNKVNKLTLKNIEGLNDLSFLEGINNGYGVDLSLIGLNDLYDLSPLKNVTGSHLTVPPHVADQAEELVNEGIFKDYSVEYPDGSWDPFNDVVNLLNLGELETLPKALLKHVERLCIVGDTLVDLDHGDILETWDDDSETTILLYHNYETDESIPLEYGTGTITDISIFNDLTGLKELQLFDQPIDNLNGIQNLSKLENLRIRYCSSLKDASAVFACQQLSYIDFQGCPVESINGIQNLPNLIELNINQSKVTDISPLKKINYSYSAEQGGFALWINDAPIEDYSALSSVPVFRILEINNIDDVTYLSYLKNVEIHRFSACNSFKNVQGKDSNALFADFLRNHPELRELVVSWDTEITDLTPVLKFQNLEYLRVSYDMDKAIKSLEGKDYSFELEIEGNESQDEV